MNNLASFDISFAGLKNGTHEFRYRIDKQFFEEFVNSPVSDGDFEVLMTMEKSPAMMLLDFKITGSVDVNCDRCLRAIKLPMQAQQEFIIKFGVETSEALDNIMTLSANEYKINVAQHIYEYISLMLPVRTVCEDSDMQLKCDDAIIEKLNKLSAGQDQMQGDPRWEQLKKLKTK